jgi:hypothetical protein
MIDICTISTIRLRLPGLTYTLAMETLERCDMIRNQLNSLLQQEQLYEDP